jgi:hypothetical protein
MIPTAAGGVIGRGKLPYYAAMIIFAFFLSALATGLLFALGARTQGIDHDGVLFAIGVIGAGLQMVLIMVWYLRHTSEKAQRARIEPLPSMEDPSLDRLDGR